MAFSSGCLLFTALFKLLPEALNYFEKDSNSKSSNLYLMFAFASGIIVFLTFNTVLHLITSESVVHCDHEGKSNDCGNSIDDMESGDHGHNHYSDHHQSHSDSHSHSHHNDHNHHHHHHQYHHNGNSHVSDQINHDNDSISSEETSPLLKTVTNKQSKSMIHYFIQQENDIGECKGYTSAELCIFHHNTEQLQDLHFCEIPELSDQQITSTGNSLHRTRTSDSTHHHHHVTSPISRLFLIGIQTALAITLHKFPEGFITYVTSETNPQLGVTIFLSLLLHNFTEGFSICLPLYYSFESGVSKKYAKLKAFLISALLAGLSQPLGALGGYVFLKLNHIEPGSDFDDANLSFVFGITMAVTSGFLSVVGLSMYGSAISFGGSLNFVMMWCVTGIILIGLTSAMSTST